jgi:hypothetical protein
MVNVKSDYVGTETKIDLVGQFDVVVKEFNKTRNKDDSKSKDEVICKLEVPNGYHFKVGFMASFDSDIKPDMLIKAISPYTSHSVCELVSWT